MEQKYSKDRLRVLLVDDHAVLLSGLKLLLGNTNDLEVIGEAKNGSDAAEASKFLKPDVIVLDINLGDTNGLELVPQIKSLTPKTNILVLTMYGEEEYLQKALELGAKGYVLKKASDNELLTAIRTVGRGETYLDQTVAKTLVTMALGSNALKKEADRELLSSREQEVLALVALGYTNKQIAGELIISIKTVETHKANIKIKLGLNKRSELVRYAMDNNLI